MSSIARITDQFNASLLRTLCTSSLILGIPAVAWNFVAGNIAIAIALGVMVAAFGFSLFSIRRHGVTAQITLLLGSTLTLVSVLVSLVVRLVRRCLVASSTHRHP